LGLGLAICKAITEAHGGKLTAASAGLGKGATFRLELASVAEPQMGRCADLPPPLQLRHGTKTCGCSWSRTMTTLAKFSRGC
jgi:hypothetical protein